VSTRAHGGLVAGKPYDVSESAIKDVQAGLPTCDIALNAALGSTPDSLWSTESRTTIATTRGC